MGPGRPVKPMAPDGPFSAIWGRQAVMIVRQAVPDTTQEIPLRLMMRHVHSFHFKSVCLCSAFLKERVPFELFCVESGILFCYSVCHLLLHSAEHMIVSTWFDPSLSVYPATWMYDANRHASC